MKSAGHIWHLYIVRTRRGALYTGIAIDVSRRLRQHLGERKGGAKYLRGQGPLKLVYSVRIGRRALALRAEHRVKALSKAGKEAIARRRPGTRRLLADLNLG